MENLVARYNVGAMSGIDGLGSKLPEDHSGVKMGGYGGVHLQNTGGCL